MIEEDIQIQTVDGSADGVLFRPEEKGRPGVIHLTDIGGIRPAHRDMARWLATKGYVVLMPNVFYRTARPPVFDTKPTNSEEYKKKRMGELTAPLTPEAIDRDVSTYVDVLTAHLDAGADAKIGAVGYCFSGAVAMHAAATRPDKVAAAASFHGGGLFTGSESSPHLLLPQIKAELYFGHAVNDRSMPEEAIREFDRALAASGGKYKSEVYEGAHHGWTSSDSPAYNPAQAERAFEELLKLFGRTLR